MSYTHKEAFAGYLDDIPQSILDRVEDNCYHNDMMVNFICFTGERQQLVVWMDHKNPEEREDPEMLRFNVYEVTPRGNDKYDFNYHEIDENTILVCEDIPTLEKFLIDNKVTAE